MLYLVRKLDESIIINDNIEVKIVEIKGKSVKIGFEFPSTATILRKEVHDRVVAENLMAAADAMDDVDLSSISGGNADTLKLGSVSKDVLEAAKQGLKKSDEKTPQD